MAATGSSSSRSASCRIRRRKTTTFAWPCRHPEPAPPLMAESTANDHVIVVRAYDRFDNLATREETVIREKMRGNIPFQRPVVANFGIIDHRFRRQIGTARSIRTAPAARSPLLSYCFAKMMDGFVGLIVVLIHHQKILYRAHRISSLQRR